MSGLTISEMYTLKSRKWPCKVDTDWCHSFGISSSWIILGGVAPLSLQIYRKESCYQCQTSNRYHTWYTRMDKEFASFDDMLVELDAYIVECKRSLKEHRNNEKRGQSSALETARGWFDGLTVERRNRSKTDFIVSHKDGSMTMKVSIHIDADGKQALFFSLPISHPLTEGLAARLSEVIKYEALRNKIKED